MERGGSALLYCPLRAPADVSSAPLHVVEWVRRDYDIPILIKFGAHAPRVHPRYEGELPPPPPKVCAFFLFELAFKKAHNSANVEEDERLPWLRPRLRSLQRQHALPSDRGFDLTTFH